MMKSTWIRRTAALLLAATAVGVVPSAVPAPIVSAADDAGAGGEIFPVTPARIFDTRSSADEVAPSAKGKKKMNASFSVDVTGVAGVPENNVLAVAINTALIDAPARGFMSVRPSDYDPSGDEPTSLLNFEKGDTVPNFAIVGVGGDGTIEVDLKAEKNGKSHVVIDIFGWIATSDYNDAADDGARMIPLEPFRVLDTRTDNQIPPGWSGDTPLGKQQSIEVPIRGAGSGGNKVPNNASVSGVVLNMAGINNGSGNKTTYLAASPDKVPNGQAEAPTANANFAPGLVKSNFVVVPVNNDGSIFLFNRDGKIDVTLDVVGYLRKGENSASLEGRIVPLEAPFRSFDTRAADFNSVRLGYSSWEDWSFKDFAESVTLNGEVVGAQGGLLGNLAAFDLQPNPGYSSAQTFMTMNPTNSSGAPTGPPPNANLNLKNGQAVTNMSLITYGNDGDGDDYMVSAYNSSGEVHYVLDVYAVILAD